MYERSNLTFGYVESVRDKVGLSMPNDKKTGRGLKPRERSEFSSEQLKKAVELKLVSFEDFLEEVSDQTSIYDDKHDIKFFMHIERLLRELFIREKEERYLSKMNACRLVPAMHVDTCKKYIHEAESRGILLISRKGEAFSNSESAVDGRQVTVRLASDFVKRIEQKAVQKLLLAQRIASGEVGH